MRDDARIIIKFAGREFMCFQVSDNVFFDNIF